MRRDTTEDQLLQAKNGAVFEDNDSRLPLASQKENITVAAMSSDLQHALAFLEGRSTDLQTAHLSYRVLLRHAHLTDYFQGGREVLIRELRKGPPIVPRVPYFGMTTPQEQAYLEWYCTHLYEGAGEVVELGTFLGSLTKSMVNGLRANPAEAVRARKVRVFDLLWWDFVMVACVKGTAYENFAKEGDWFEEAYKKSLRSWIDRVEVNQADLTAAAYDQKPIEFLMVDVMKYEKLCVNVLRQFFPALIPGKGILFHQDYLHFYEAWVHVIQFLLRDYFEPILPIEGSAAFVFRCTREVPPEACVLKSPLTESWSNDLVEEAFAWSRSIVGAAHEPIVHSAHVMMYAHLERWEEAERAYRDHAAKFADNYSVVDLRDYVRDNFGKMLGAK